MLIKKIELENFKSFKGTQYIEFATDNVKNVTVVMGDNGAGKTTLEQAFVWCLYGERSGLGDNLLNYEIQNDLIYGKTTKASMKVKLLIESKGINYSVSRFQDIIYKYDRIYVEDKDKFFIVEMQDENGSWKRMDSLKGEERIRDLLPQELSGFFFFDGEHLDEMSTELLQKKKSANFKNAVRGLVGLNALQNTLLHLGPTHKKKTVCGKFNSEIDLTANDEIQQLSSKIEDLSGKIDEDKKIIEDLEDEIERHTENTGKFSQQLSELQDDIAKKNMYDSLAKKIKDNETKELRVVSSMFKEFAKNYGTEISQPLYKEALEEIKSADKLDKVIPYIHVDTIQFLLNAHECICGCQLQEGSAQTKRLEDLMADLPPNSLGNMIGQFSKDIRARLRNSEDFKNDFYQGMADKNEYHEAAVKAFDDRRLLEDSLNDTSQVAVLRSKINSAKNKASEYRQKANKHRISLAQNESSFKTAKSRRESLLASSSKNMKNIAYLKYAEAVYNILSGTYTRLETKTRKDLENIINGIFNDIYDGDIQISVDNEYRITSTLKGVLGGGSNLQKNTAQNYAIIFAFIVGIIKLVKLNREKNPQAANYEDGYPLVMDAPLSSFDKTRIKNICHAIPEIAKQVIIFIKDTDGEIAEEHLSSKIGARYDLQAINKTQSTIEMR